MTDAQEALVRVREALSAGPTPGKWTVDIHGDQVHVIDMDVTAIARVMAQRVAGPFNAAFIAACSPANVSDILAHVDAQAAEIERLRELLCKCDMRTRLVGDGCEFCNPQLAEELAKEQR